jgi:Flp pilus assembly protein TadG
VKAREAIRRVRRRARDTERGAAVAEFAMLMTLFLALVFGIIQLALYLHVRNTVASCAHEGARLGANYNKAPADGVPWTRNCINGALAPRFSQNVSASQDSADGQPMVVITVNTNMPALGFFGPGFDFTVRGHAIREPQPGT